MLSIQAPLEAIREHVRLLVPPLAARRRRILAGWVALITMAVPLMLPLPAAAQPLRGEASLSTSGGYARLVIRLPREIETQVRVTGNVLAIFFKEPVSIAIDRLGGADYIGAARRDPDGRALRFALARKVKVNSIAAAERLYVDLLPESWTAAAPSLPQEVVEDLAKRTREAERKARQEAELAELRKVAPVRVRVAMQPTFTRYILWDPLESTCRHASLSIL